MPDTLFEILVHHEPVCESRYNRCDYDEPHTHGHDCDNSCVECGGFCHPKCPAYGKEEF